jgi:hypothetical protein
MATTSSDMDDQNVSPSSVIAELWTKFIRRILLTQRARGHITPVRSSPIAALRMLLEGPGR